MTGLGILGASVASSLFGATIATTSFAAIATGIVTSAVVGAAIGGLSAAVMGGDIGQGMLFGAIGGVITGGIAGGAIVDAFGGAGTTVTAAGGEIVTTVGGSASASLQAAESAMLYGVEAAGGGVTTQAAGAGLFGGAVNLGAQGIGSTLLSKGIDFAAAGTAPEAETPWGATEEGQRAQMESAERMNALRVSASGSNALPFTSTEAGMKLAGAQRQSEIGLQNEGSLSQIKAQGENAYKQNEQSYKLSELQADAAMERVYAKHGKAADASSSATYQGADQALKDKVIAEQEALS